MKAFKEDSLKCGNKVRTRYQESYSCGTTSVRMTIPSPTLVVHTVNLTTLQLIHCLGIFSAGSASQELSKMNLLPPLRQEFAFTTTATNENHSISNSAQMNVAHASGCSDPKCPLPFCVNLKMASSHARTCTRRNCDTCLQVKLITLRHAKSCRRDSSCPMPFCLETKVKQQYMKLMTELGEDTSTSKNAAWLDHSGDLKTSTNAITTMDDRCSSYTKRHRPDQVQQDDRYIAPADKLPRKEKEVWVRPQTTTTFSPQETQSSSHAFGLQDNRLVDANQILSNKYQSSVPPKATEQGILQPGNPLLHVLQQLIQVLAFSKTHEQEVVFVGLLERTLHEAQAISSCNIK